MLAFHVTEILHPDQLINQLGTAATIVIFLLVFAENGLLLGFFLPGDSLLVLAGLYSTSKAGGDHGQHTHLNIAVVIPVIILASIIGSEVGYQIGKVVGPKLFNKPDSRLFKHEHVERTRVFLERYGESKAVFLSRFMPIIRPFVNSAVGVVEMPRPTFTLINIAASIGWGAGLPLIGFTVGKSVPHISTYIPYITLAIIIGTGAPVVNEIRKARKTT